jgi:hypothetical protein
MMGKPWKQTLAGWQDAAKSLGEWWLADYGTIVVRGKKWRQQSKAPTQAHSKRVHTGCYKMRALQGVKEMCFGRFS